MHGLMLKNTVRVSVMEEIFLENRFVATFHIVRR
jgi:hypothetical protein